MKTYWVLVGSFGSGKSELALNLALEKAKEGPCTLVDLDVINPYFRTSERGDVRHGDCDSGVVDADKVRRDDDDACSGGGGAGVSY